MGGIAVGTLTRRESEIDGTRFHTYFTRLPGTPEIPDLGCNAIVAEDMAIDVVAYLRRQLEELTRCHVGL